MRVREGGREREHAQNFSHVSGTKRKKESPENV